MKDFVNNGKDSSSFPILLPVEEGKFFSLIRQIIREEIHCLQQNSKNMPHAFSAPGLTQKPLFKLAEVCDLFQVTKPTIYDWVKHGKLKPFKVRSRVYFLWQDIETLLPK